ncbi:C40 family peptidase [Quadrisphaera sp. DSM 44207]|uniref:C40 family peptidase n=1 Tax=Quadrisphaera sp. DSM 44207 TaxID=1881057 RepID=UPI00088CD8A9|nr:C40 family peptidase [Quadrisphaera sp. DSM 44207]SDQ23433.1 Cell wall-associated hydrolase, NlpC family [Quadrisphaera sp. DSM 44207]
MEDLEHRVEVAAEEHAAAADALAAAVADEVAAERDLASARDAARSQRAAAARRTRAVYASGAPLGLPLQLLGGAEPADVADSARAVRALVASDARAVEEARRTAASASAAAEAVQRSRAERQRLEQLAGAAARAADTALAQRALLLARADARAAALLEQAREDEERRALERAASAAATELGADPAAPPPPGEAGEVVRAALDAARSRLGSPYAWGATGPDAFDCSGLVQWAYRQAGVRLPRTTRQQYAALPRVPLDDLRPGDLVFYASGAEPGSIHHVGLYLGDGVLLHAPRTGDVVRTAAVTRSRAYGAVRPGGAASP